MVPAKFDTPAEALRGSFESNFRMPFDDDTKYARLFGKDLHHHGRYHICVQSR